MKLRIAKLLRPRVHLADLWHQSRGATAIEYGLILALVFLVIIVGVGQTADSTIGIWNRVSSRIVNAR